MFRLTEGFNLLLDVSVNVYVSFDGLAACPGSSPYVCWREASADHRNTVSYKAGKIMDVDVFTQ